MTSIVEIRTRVEELLQQFRILNPPIPVDQLAKTLGILLCPLLANDEISGSLCAKTVVQEFVDQYWNPYLDRIEAKPSTRKSSAFHSQERASDLKCPQSTVSD